MCLIFCCGADNIVAGNENNELTWEILVDVGTGCFDSTLLIYKYKIWH